MLGKLLKYEIKATGRTFVPFYTALVVFALITRIFSGFEGNNTVGNSEGFMVGISILVYTCLIVAIFVLTFVVMLQRFYKNLLSDEGYLMFTLPVQPYQHILAKLITSLMWGLCSIIVTLLSVGLLVVNQTFFLELPDFFKALWYALGQMGLDNWITFVEFFFLLFFAAINGVLMLYASIAIGQQFGRHKLIASFGAFLAIQVVLQMLESIFNAISGVNFNGALMGIYSYTMHFNMAMLYSIIQSVVLSVVFFIVTNYLLSKRLNLE